MYVRGRIPEDAPDPRIGRHERLREMPASVMGLVAQPTLEDCDDLAISDGHDQAGLVDFSVNVTYTLWRNPTDRSDPINLADLDERTRAQIERGSSRPRPQWLIERVGRLRYPQLWEAVRTTWSRDVSENSTLTYQLVNHVDYILINRYRDRADRTYRPLQPTERRVAVESVNPDVTVTVDGVETRAAEIDTDPHVYAIGAQIASGTVVTAVLPRDELHHIEIAFVSRTITDVR